MEAIPEYSNVDDAPFKNEITAQYRPAILRGFIKHGPGAQHAQTSPEAVCKYLMALDSGKNVNVLLRPPMARSGFLPAGPCP